MTDQRGTGRTRRQLFASALYAAPAVLAACGTPGQTGGPNAGGDVSGPRQAAPRTPVALDIAWENTTNEMGLFVTGRAKEIFQERHPGVTLNFVGGGNQQAKVTAQLAAGTPPHVLHLSVNLPAYYVQQNALLPVDTYVQKDKDVKKADFATNMWDTFTVKGKQYAIPREAGPTVLYYNKSILQGGGVETPAEPWTMSGKYREAAVKLTNQDRSVIGTHLGNWRNWVYSAGGDVVDAQGLKYVLDQQKAVDGLQLYQDFRYRFNAATTPQENSEQGFIERFIAGGLAMTAGVRSAGNNKGFVQPNVGIAQHPKGSAGRKFVMPGNGLSIVQPNTAPEASWDVVKWYTSPEFQKMHYSMGIGGVVARPAVLKSEEYLTSSIPREWNEFFAKGVPDLTMPPKLPNWNEILSTVNSELAEFENGRETARAATTRIAPIVNALLAENTSWLASK